MIALLRVVPIWAWALVAALAWGGWQRHRATSAGAELLAERERTAQIREESLRGALTTVQRRLDAQREVTNHARDEADRARAARARADAAAARVRDEADALRRRVADSAAAGRCEAASDAAGVLADVFRQADERAGILARVADERGVALDACQRSYDALTAR